MESLFVVESPTKIKTLKKLLSQLGINTHLIATLGHLKDLPHKSLGVDLTNFQPKFYYLRPKLKILKLMQEKAKIAKTVYLATDPDREGEAIGYHVWEFLKNLNHSIQFLRLDLKEITSLGVKVALAHPRSIDEKLYQSFLARRILDRLIGYLVSPYLSKSLKQSLSAGRVQSPALRLIVEREREIRNFTPKVSYGVKLILEVKEILFEAELYQDKRPLRSENEEDLKDLLKKILEAKDLLVTKVEDKTGKEAPPLPFKTSTLIEEAGKNLGYSTKETMKLAQTLYEKGFITYHRTDSTRISPLAREATQKYIEEAFGKDYVGKKARRDLGKFVQDAHEAIRPTKISLLPEKVSSSLTPKEAKLYRLIWVRFLASQMASALYQESKVYLKSQALPSELFFLYQGKKLLFPGFKIFFKEEKTKDLFKIEEGERVNIKEGKIERHQTKPPSRYTEESLIRKLESLGIGRPSTYASMLDVLYRRGYVKKVKRELIPTPLGERVCDFLLEKTPFFMDYVWTSHLEKELDRIAKGEKDYREIAEGVLKKIRECLKG